MNRLTKTSACLVFALAACGGGTESSGPDAGPRPDATITPAAIAHFEPPTTTGEGADWGAVPFPSDIYLDDDGLLSVRTLPTGAGPNDAYVDVFIDALHSMNGAGLWSFAYFPIDGAIDPATLEGNVKLVELDGLTEIPVDLVWREDLSAIIARPKRGHLLREETSYAAWVTSAVTADDGSPLARSVDFAETVEPSGAGSHPGIDAARAHLAPLLEALDSETAGSLAAATVFKTESVSAEAVAMREVIAASPPEKAAVVRTFAGAAALDELFGQTMGNVPGTFHDTNQHRGQPHQSVSVALHGTVDLKRFLSDDPHVDGLTEFVDGVPTVKGTETVTFTLILPDGGSWADVPVVIYVPGINRTRGDMLTQAGTATSRGMALLAIDMPYHGDRGTDPVDAKNEITGAETPDGFADDKGLLPATQIFHLRDSGGLAAYDPRAMRENLRQASMDVCSMVEFIADGDLSAIRASLAATDPGLPTDLSFRDEVVLLTESFGAMVSGPCLAVEPRVSAATYSSPAAGFPFPSMIHSPNFSALFLNAVTTPFGIGDRVELGHPTRGAEFEPMMMLYNSILERGEISGFAAHILPGTLRGGEGPHVSLTMAWADEWVSNDTTEHLAGVMGMHQLVTENTEAPPGPTLRFVELPTATTSLEGNVSEGQTAGITVLYPSAHAALRKYSDSIRFEPDFPPFVELEEPVPLERTPIANMHRQWRGFFEDVFAGRTPRLQDTYGDDDDLL